MSAGVRVAASALVVGLLVAGCSVNGDPVGDESDLTARAVAASSFPSGPATRVPTPAVKDALADITGRPLRGDVSPAGCTPGAMRTESATVLVGASPQAGGVGTLTSAVVGTDESLADLTATARRCPVVTLGAGGGATTRVSTEVAPAPPTVDGVETTALRRSLQTGGDAAPLVTTVTLLIAQRDDVRVYVEERHQGAAPLTEEAGAALDRLFTASVSAAFG
ncbi:hypothetical protein [Gordonia soli]|uniref:hypothetical protein n=1 Tax=Gordonia soli TaxID=320799 RepID=UPI00058D45B4|nr:hypothetical protein [Gordonia soli]